MTTVDLEIALREEWDALVREHPVRPELSPLTLPPPRRLPLSRTALFAELEELRVRWRRLGPAIARHASRYVNAGWTLRELIAHLASWAREFRFEVETVARGESFDYAIPFALSVVGPNEWNAAEVQRRWEAGIDELLEELERETRQLQELVLTLSDEALQGPALFPHAPSGNPEERTRATNAVVIHGRCRHDRHHLAQVESRLRAWESPS